MKKLVKKIGYLSFSTLLLSFAAHTFALDLQEAKEKGLVGETPLGYLASPNGSASGEVKALIDDINSKRKEKYDEVAAKVGKPVSIVEKLAGEKAIEKTESGHYIQSPEGAWQKKK